MSLIVGSLIDMIWWDVVLLAVVLAGLWVALALVLRTLHEFGYFDLRPYSGGEGVGRTGTVAVLVNRVNRMAAILVNRVNRI